MPISHSALARPGTVAFAALVSFAAACGASSDVSQQAPGRADELMKRGLAQLYQTNQPVIAQETFRAVLRVNPTHYGAHYQLGVALDKGGNPVEARKAWDETLKMAEAIRDTATLRVVRKRLASPDSASQEGMMALGLHLVWVKGDYGAAAAQFRALLRRNPTHYGATYQLASALEKNGQPGQARPIWERVLGMAIQYKDETTAQIARSHLK